MANIDLKKRTISCKIVYYGPGLSGKTCNLRSVHEKLESHQKGRLSSLATKTNITTYIEVVPVSWDQLLGLDATFRLCAVPGQAIFNKTRKLLLKDTDGVVFVADSRPERHEANLDTLEALKEHLDEYDLSLQTMPHVFQYNKRDLENTMSVSDMRATLNLHGAPDFEASAINGKGVMETLRAIIDAIGRDLKTRL